MKNVNIVIALILFAFTSNAQTVNSSCTAPENIVSIYRNDADRLAMARIFRNNFIQKDSIEIPDSLSDPVLNALIAVYNATTLPARDSVVNMFHCHTYPDSILNGFRIIGDSTATWMQALRQGNIPTGTASLDSVLIPYGFTVYQYLTYLGLSTPWHAVSFKSVRNFNISALLGVVSGIPGVYSAEPLPLLVGGGGGISDSVYADHIELVFAHGWGDCPSGCIYKRYWKFNVYADCSVEYVNSYGDIIQGTTAINDIHEEDVSIYPNPFSRIINIKGISGPFEYSVCNLLGKEILSGQAGHNALEALDKLKPGIYLLRIKTKDREFISKVCKK